MQVRRRRGRRRPLRADARAPRQVHVSARRSGDVYIHGELESRIDHLASTWCTDGETVTLSLVKANLVIRAGMVVPAVGMGEAAKRSGAAAGGAGRAVHPND
mgnify:CR=1 FL=1